MARPEWFPKDSGGLVDALISTGEACGVGLACLPHLRAVAEELVTGKPSASVDPIMHEAWRPALTGVMALVPMLIADTIIELPSAASSLASDGEKLYTMHGMAIGCVDLATRTFTQIAGQPSFGTGQFFAAGGGKARDGSAEVAVIASARFLSYDAGSLWFVDNDRVRRFDLAARQMSTPDLG